MRSALLAIAAAALSVTAVHAEPATYAVDPTHTFATFEIGHFGASVNRGRFDKKEGMVQFDKHLQSADIFDAAKYPTAQFVGDKFTYEGDKLTAVSGNLTIKGKTQPVTFKANQFACYESPMLKREVCGGDFETTIDRTLFGADYGVQYGFPKNVRIVAQIEAVKQ